MTRWVSGTILGVDVRTRRVRQQRNIVNLRRRERDWLPALFRNERERAGERLGVEANADERNAGATCRHVR